MKQFAKYITVFLSGVAFVAACDQTPSTYAQGRMAATASEAVKYARNILFDNTNTDLVDSKDVQHAIEALNARIIELEVQNAEMENRVGELEPTPEPVTSGGSGGGSYKCDPNNFDPSDPNFCG